MLEDLYSIKEQLFDAPSEVKEAFNTVVGYFDTEYFAIKGKIGEERLGYHKEYQRKTSKTYTPPKGKFAIVKRKTTEDGKVTQEMWVYLLVPENRVSDWKKFIEENKVDKHNGWEYRYSEPKKLLNTRDEALNECIKLNGY